MAMIRIDPLNYAYNSYEYIKHPDFLIPSIKKGANILIVLPYSLNHFFESASNGPCESLR